MYVMYRYMYVMYVCIDAMLNYGMLWYVMASMYVFTVIQCNVM